MSGARTDLSVGIVGCGLIGQKRGAALSGARLVGCYDVDADRAHGLALQFGGAVCADVDELLALHPDVVVVATEHRSLAEIAAHALESGAHVLLEKPGGIGTSDIDRVADAAKRSGRLVKVGFNHRFHPGISRAIATAQSGEFGEVFYLRARYGHGGRLGYEKEWRADPVRSGGGEIVDQGMHLLDLSHWLHGPLPLHASMLRTQFWNAPVDDNAVLLLGGPGGVGDPSPFSLLHVSWTEWKNTFSLEIACRHAKIAVDGLVRSYGPQHLRIYRMRPELGPPDLEEVDYPDEDTSWHLEWRHFVDVITGKVPELSGDLESALRLGDHRVHPLLMTGAMLSGHHVVVTGASRGIGRCVAQRLAEHGATLALIAHDPIELARTRASLRGGPHEIFPLDVSDEDAWRAAAPSLFRPGAIHGLVTAAGVIGPIGPAGRWSVAEFRATVDINLIGTLLAVTTCLPELRRGGSVVTFSGGGATGPFPRFDAYAVSKAAVVRLSENLASEFATSGIRINAIAPGFVVTDMHRDELQAGPEVVGEEYFSRTKRAVQEGLGDPPELAASLTCFLLSNAAEGITGKLISARWDPWEDHGFQQRLREERDLATLRRIDDQFFRAADAQP